MSFIWSVADLLRGSYCPDQYQNAILPMTFLHRLDFVLEPTKDKKLAEQKEIFDAVTGKIDVRKEIL